MRLRVRLRSWLSQDQPDRELLTQLRELWHASDRRATACRDRRTGESWTRPDGRERLNYSFRVLTTVQRAFKRTA